MTTKKKAGKKKPAPKKSAVKKKTTTKKASKKAPPRKTASKKAAKKNKWGVKNSLVNNINARKKNGKSRAKKNSTIDKKSYEKMEENWGRGTKSNGKSKK